MLTDGEIIEVLRISTRITLHYESILARETGSPRPYSLDASKLSPLLARADTLLRKDGRESISAYGSFGFVDQQVASRLLFEALDIIHARYGITSSPAGTQIVKPTMET